MKIGQLSPCGKRLEWSRDAATLRPQPTLTGNVGAAPHPAAARTFSRRGEEGPRTLQFCRSNPRSRHA